MCINVHAHVFTLRTVLSGEAIRIVGRRLEDRGFRDFVVGAVERLLDEQLDHPSHLVEEELLSRFLKAIAESDAFRRFVEEEGPELPFAVRVLTGDLASLGVAALQTSLDRLSGHLERRDGPGTGPFDIFQTLRLAMQPDVSTVAGRLLDHMGPDDALVALMMDVRAPDESDRDRRNFQRQIDETSEAVLQYPGRVLPFVAVNPTRPGFFDIMRDAVEERGFVGVKLYPSLGYEVGGPEMIPVYQYCVDNDLPLLTHCTHGGFYAQKQFVDLCDPARWQDVLTRFPELRLCFAHFGGWESLGKADGLDAGTWGGTIVDLMERHANVYADLSYHVDMLNDPEDEARYFDRLTNLLGSDPVGGRILFGTDSWLLRLNMSDAHYWAYFRSKLDENRFLQIADANPRGFLGIPVSAGESARPNIERYVSFVEKEAGRVGSPPAAWLAGLTEVAFEARRPRAAWRPDRQAARLAYTYFKAVMPSAVKKRGFKNNADTPLRHMKYWREGLEPDSLFKQRCTAHARDLVAFCKVNDGAYESTHDDTSAVERMITVLSAGDRTLVDVANEIDCMFRFPTPA